MKSITVEELLDLCGYGTSVNIKLSDTGKVVIRGVSCLKNSKDKRQKAKWEVFKNKEVFYISPTIDIASAKRSRYYGDCFRVIIEASMYSYEYEKAMEEVNNILRG